MYVQSPEMGVPLTFGLMRKPVVLHLHGAANPLVASRYIWARKSIMRHVYARLQKRMITASCRVFSVDDAGLRLGGMYLGEEGATSLLLVPICVDTSLFCPGDRSAARAAHGLAASDKVVIFVGRLEEAKGIEQLVDAFALLAQRTPPTRLVVVGDGSQRGAMEERARGLGVHDRIAFVGWVEHDQLPLLLQATDALVLPSAHEGLPTAVLEALACGIPVVATAVGDVPKLVHDGINGLLLRELSPQPLAQALDRVLASSWSADDVAASVRDYSADSVASLISRLLCEAANGAD